MKCHVKGLEKGYKADNYLVQHLKWSGVYPRIKMPSYFIQNVLKLVPLTSTGPEVYITTMTIFLPNSCDTLEETLTHMKSLKLKSYAKENIAD